MGSGLASWWQPIQRGRRSSGLANPSRNMPGRSGESKLGIIPDRHGNDVVRVRFPLPVCRLCPSHDACMTSPARVLIFQPAQEAYEALQQACDRANTPTFHATYAKRAGIEGTVAQTVRTCDLRQARQIGKKVHPRALLTAPAVNVLCICVWVAEEMPGASGTLSFS